jgi:phosphate transport system permease protein
MAADTEAGVTNGKVLPFNLNISRIISSDASSRRIFFRKIKDHIFKSIIIFFALAATVPLFLIFLYIFQQGIATIIPDGLLSIFTKGVGAINWGFFVNLPTPVGEVGGGIANAIIGSGMLIILASLFSIPIGVLAGIYLSEFKHSKLSYWIGLSMEVLQGVPSIVIGIIAYVWIVKPTQGFSLFSGAIALGIMMLPVIARTTEETLKLVPTNLKEASLALGAPYYLTILRVLLPAGVTGIITGILVSMARIAGETAPLLFTAFGNPYMNTNIFKPVESIPHLIYYYATSPYDDWRAIAWGASLVLIGFVLIVNIVAKVIVQKWKVRY